MNLTCQACGSRYTTKRNDPSTWSCPTCHPAGVVRQRFTVDPKADTTKFTQATRPTR